MSLFSVFGLLFQKTQNLRVKKKRLQKERKKRSLNQK
jgi:hypothetical protein